MTGNASGSDAATLRPLRRDAQRNRERIMQAAVEVFAVRGFAATLDDVAHHAGLGIGTVYRRFPTKEALIEAVFNDKLKTFVALAEQALTAPTGWEGLTSFLRHAARLHAGNRGLRDAALSAGVEQRHFARVGEQIVPLTERLIDRAQAEGTLRPDVNVHDVPVILAMISHLPARSPGVRPGLHERYLQLILDGLRAGSGTGDLGPALTAADVEAVVHGCVPAIGARRG